MTTEILSIYHTKKGDVAIELRKHTSAGGRVSYSYIGKYGAGCCAYYSDVCIRVRAALEYKRGYVLVSGIDIEKE